MMSPEKDKMAEEVKIYGLLIIGNGIQVNENNLGEI
jgi:hypothetical protein